MKNTYDLAQVCEICRVHEDLIFRFVSYSWIKPAQENIFDREDLARIRLIHQLQEHFGVNDEAVSIVLNLVDQLNRIHREIKIAG